MINNQITDEQIRTRVEALKKASGYSLCSTFALDVCLFEELLIARAELQRRQKDALGSKPVAVVDIQRGRGDGRKYALCYTKAGHSLPDDVYNLYVDAQPASGWQSIDVTDAMAYAFHHSLTDGPLGDDDVEDIKTGLRAAFATITTNQPAPVVSDEFMPGGLVYSSALPKFGSNDSDTVVGYSCFISGETRIVGSQEQAYADAKAVVNACNKYLKGA